MVKLCILNYIISDKYSYGECGEWPLCQQNQGYLGPRLNGENIESLF